MQPGIPSASEMIRNLSQVTGGFEVLFERGEFRVVRFSKVIDLSDIWVVNDKGFFWEPVDSLEQGIRFIDTELAT
jgi:hypothetical protein